MIAAAAAIAPVFLIIALGWVARRAGIGGETGWDAFNGIVYALLFPALLFQIVARTDFTGLSAGSFAAAAACGYVLMGALMWALRPALRMLDGPAYTSVFQAAVRWNGFVLLAAAGSLFGPQGVALTALMFAPTVPLSNIMSVTVLSRWGAHGGPGLSLMEVLKRLATNPLIIACALGGLVNALQWRAPAPLEEALDLLAQATLATALLGVGAGLRFNLLKTRPRILALCLVLKLVGMPLIMGLMAVLFRLGPLETTVLVTGGATSTAAASYILARQMGGDAELAAAAVTAGLLASMVTLPLAATLAGRLTGL